MLTAAIATAVLCSTYICRSNCIRASNCAPAAAGRRRRRLLRRLPPLTNFRAATRADRCRDKRKKKTGKKPGAGADKTERKTTKNEDKQHRRQERAAQVTPDRWMLPAV